MEDKTKVLEDVFDVIACNNNMCSQDAIIKQFDIEIDYQSEIINIYKLNHESEDRPIFILIIKQN